MDVVCEEMEVRDEANRWQKVARLGRFELPTLSFGG
jgi:hypothetical protein